MIRFIDAPNAWGTAEFKVILQREIERLSSEELPLQQGLSSSSHVVGNPISAMIISASEEENVIRATAGIFYAGIVAGCSCADDPTPVTEQLEYCVVELLIDKATGATTVRLVEE